MKVVNTEAVQQATKPASKAFTTLYNRQTGKAQDFHTIDANEILEGYSHVWSATPVAKEQVGAEDAVIIPDAVELPKANDETESVTETLPRRGRRPSKITD
jgi:hypothetical protein